jgi:hypothetical protein
MKEPGKEKRICGKALCLVLVGMENVSVARIRDISGLCVYFVQIF